MLRESKDHITNSTNEIINTIQTQTSDNIDNFFKALNETIHAGKIDSYTESATGYNLGSNCHEKAAKVASKYDAEPYWMAIQFDAHEYSVYFGSLDSLDGANAIPINKCEEGEIGCILVHNKRHYFDFDYFKN